MKILHLLRRLGAMSYMADDDGGGGTASDAPTHDVGDDSIDSPEDGNLLDAVSSSAPVGMQSIMDEDGVFQEGWTETLNDDYADSKATLASYKSFKDLAQGHIETKRALSKKTDGMVRVPDENADKLVLEAWRSAVGAPESPEGYELKDPGNLPEGMEFNEEFAKGISEIAHKHHVPKAAIQEMFEAYNAAQAQGMEASMRQQVAQLEEQKGILQESWGNRFDENMVKAKQAMITSGMIDLKSSSLRNADVMRFAAWVGEQMGPDRLVNGGEIDMNTSQRMQADDIINNPNNPEHDLYWKGSGPKHKELVEKVSRWLASKQ